MHGYSEAFPPVVYRASLRFRKYPAGLLYADSCKRFDVWGLGSARHREQHLSDDQGVRTPSATEHPAICFQHLLFQEEQIGSQVNYSSVSPFGVVSPLIVNESVRNIGSHLLHRLQKLGHLELANQGKHLSARPFAGANSSHRLIRNRFSVYTGPHGPKSCQNRSGVAMSWWEAWQKRVKTSRP